MDEDSNEDKPNKSRLLLKTEEITKQIAESRLRKIPIPQHWKAIKETKMAILKAFENTFKDTNNFDHDVVIRLFDEIIKKEGLFAVIHKQRNPITDWFRVIIKRRANDNPKDFFHTTSFIDAIGMLKDACWRLEQSGKKPSPEQQEKIDKIIDYVRGNAPMHRDQTSTREKFGPKNK